MAQIALTKYDMLANDVDRRRFLKDFQENGAGRGGEALKFASTFAKTLEHVDTTVIGQTSDMYTVGEILQFNGRPISSVSYTHLTLPTICSV